jgi:hypothetical protein
VQNQQTRVSQARLQEISLKNFTYLAQKPHKLFTLKQVIMVINIYIEMEKKFNVKESITSIPVICLETVMGNVLGKLQIPSNFDLIYTFLALYNKIFFNVE